MQPNSNDLLVTALRQGARELMTRRSISDLEQTLTQIVVAAVETVPGADAGGISVTENGRIDSRSPSGDDILYLDRLQTELHEGPCVTALEQPPEGEVIMARDLAGPDDAKRWPAFAPQAVERGYRSMLSTQLTVAQRSRAALNLYSRTPGVFDDSAQTLANLFGVQAALLLYGAGEVAGLSKALDTRDVIGQAKGILMERFAVDEDQAFQLLVRSSQDTNLKLVAIARWLTTDRGATTHGPQDLSTTDENLAAARLAEPGR